MDRALADGEVQELIRIADANIKERKGHWFTLWIPITSHYNLNEQLDAIRRLGETGSKTALAYLEKLNFTEAGTIYNTSWNGFGDSFGDILYPNAKRELKKALEEIFYGGVTTHVSGSSKHPRQTEARKTLEEAIARLRE